MGTTRIVYDADPINREQFQQPHKHTILMYFTTIMAAPRNAYCPVDIMFVIGPKCNCTCDSLPCHALAAEKDYHVAMHNGWCLHFQEDQFTIFHRNIVCGPERWKWQSTGEETIWGNMRSGYAHGSPNIVYKAVSYIPFESGETIMCYHVWLSTPNKMRLSFQNKEVIRYVLQVYGQNMFIIAITREKYDTIWSSPMHLVGVFGLCTYQRSHTIYAMSHCSYTNHTFRVYKKQAFDVRTHDSVNLWEKSVSLNVKVEHQRPKMAASCWTRSTSGREWWRKIIFNTKTTVKKMRQLLSLLLLLMSLYQWYWDCKCC